MSLDTNHSLHDAEAFLVSDPLSSEEGRLALLSLIAKGVPARERGEEDTRDAVNLLRDAGVGKLRISKDEGGYGLSLPELIGFATLLGQSDPSVAQILRNHFAFVEHALRNRGLAHYERGLTFVKQGKLIGLGATEQGVAQAGTMKSDTALVRENDEFRMTGRKFYSTGNMYSDYIRVYASLDGQLISALIPADREGVAFEDDWDGFGQSRTASGTTVLANVRVLPEEIFPAEEKVKLPFSATFPQLYLTAIVVGIIREVEADAISVLKRRGRNFYHAVAEQPTEDPLLQADIGRIASIAFVAESAVIRAATALGAAFDSAINGEIDHQAFELAAQYVAKSKVILDGLALDAANSLFSVAGASATSRAAQLDRHWRNIRTLASHNPVSYKARAIGNHAVNGNSLPSAGFF
ncbi:acyl-CoA dehydrogenase [Pseudomonas sp. v388]|uniref:acyl-CoA dehydrogenase n=1 Tax=Pseudomonas sp. v388 TaxID=2479849 RepID=UPI000F770AC2|nr:acyl-CoA dehydrogenase [Pseudomonas sp. v388]RRV10462.1 acyl-CoA dehydrogenase [Pseudomonas sp. v388]